MRSGRGTAALARGALIVGRGGSRAVRRTPIGRVLEMPAVRRALKRILPQAKESRVIVVAELLESWGLPYWVAGGWGVDALVGRQTRPHRDLDLVVRDEDMAALTRALVTAGFRPINNGNEDHAYKMLRKRCVFEDRQGYVLDVHPVPAPGWPDDDDLFATGSIAGRELPCLSEKAQRASRRGYALDESDIHDLQQLDLQTSLV